MCHSFKFLLAAVSFLSYADLQRLLTFFFDLANNDLVMIVEFFPHTYQSVSCELVVLGNF
jgi:hypothetical protein